MSTPSSSIFAREILYEIVGHLHGDTETVKTLSVVSSSFLPICREVLFYSLRLTIQNCARWNRYLSASPSIGNSIQEVEVEVKALLSAGEQQVMFVLDRVTGPRMIAFRMFNYALLDWPTVPRWFQDALLRTLSTPSIRRVDISRFSNLPISLLSGLPHLRKLQLRCCSFPTPTIPTPTSNVELRSSGPQVPKTRVDALHVNTAGRSYGQLECALDQWIGHLDFPLDLTHLASLYIDVEQRNEGKVQDLLRMCGQSHLSLSMRGGSICLEHLSALCVLQFCICIMHGTGGHAIGTFPGLFRTLKSLESNEHPPKEIIIAAFLELDEFSTIPMNHWEDFDSHLVKLSPITVRIITTCRSTRPGGMPDWSLLLPSLSESGRLISEWQSHEWCYKLLAQHY
ncbi:hypothetical protein BDN72DRAFT_961636 [Pluteus cervinus]|uniref:Uncharacterized protein n=1 Tax=Pluteus cervinus TaxID=181527 RepID=A0ACD3AM83_9AGAR|nr:hypothetical protein BDN72DRAFT_961636 [Pluteus cervinus]